MDMEAPEGEIAAARPRMAAANTSTLDVGSTDSRLARGLTPTVSELFLEEFMRVRGPLIYDGRRDYEVVEGFLRRLETYLSLFQGEQEEKVVVAASFLKGDAKKWWTSLCHSGRLPRSITTVQAFLEAVSQKFVPSSVRQQALEELMKLKQGRLSLHSYIMKYRSLVQRSGVTNKHFLYQRLVAGLNRGPRNTVLSWTVLRKESNLEVEIEEVIRLLRIYEEMSAAPFSLAVKCDKNPVLGKGKGNTGKL